MTIQMDGGGRRTVVASLGDIARELEARFTGLVTAALNTDSNSEAVDRLMGEACRLAGHTLSTEQVEEIVAKLRSNRSPQVPASG